MSCLPCEICSTNCNMVSSKTFCSNCSNTRDRATDKLFEELVGALRDVLDCSEKMFETLEEEVALDIPAQQIIDAKIVLEKFRNS